MIHTNEYIVKSLDGLWYVNSLSDNVNCEPDIQLECQHLNHLQIWKYLMKVLVTSFEWFIGSVLSQSVHNDSLRDKGEIHQKYF